MSEWQPIETAPSGTILLMCSMKAQEVRTCMYVDWLVDGKLCGDSTRPDPTHWMPLPEYPK
jgi:hypothetical protein